MKLSIGIVGLPNVGKSTLFQILTKNKVTIANYPFCTIDPNVGIVAVPDERLRLLAQASASERVIPAVIELYDIAGLVKGASKGEGLGNQFLSHIRETDAMIIVLRCFKNEAIVHVENSVDPMRDLQIINSELTVKDLETVERKLEKAESDTRSGNAQAIASYNLLRKVSEALKSGEPAMPYAKEPLVASLHLLSSKRRLYLLNGRSTDVPASLLSFISSFGGGIVTIDLAVAEEIPELISEAYRTLNLISFFTTGKTETRAWTIERGTRIAQAAGVIHSDFEKKFIRADVIHWEDLLDAGNWGAAQKKGLIRTEGKSYIVNDGDVIVVKHSA